MKIDYFVALFIILVLCLIPICDYYLKKKKEQHRHEKAEKLFKQLKAGKITEDEYDHEMEFLDL